MKKTRKLHKLVVCVKCKGTGLNTVFPEQEK